MFKSFIFYFYVSTICFGFSDMANLECSFQSQGWHVLGNLYYCSVSKGISINSIDTAYVNSTTGSHKSGQTNDDVNYLFIHLVTISYFPSGLDAIFKNLKGIYLSSVGLKEIHQSDLKPFPKLVEFLIYQNSHIEILEEGLFDFNPDLEYINLSFNKITHIDPKVFNSLTKLKQLHLSSNICINKSASDRTSVQNLLSKCNNSDYSSLDQKLKLLESESKSLNFIYFKEELEKLESQVNTSKFVNFYQTKLQNLKSILNEKSQNVQNCSVFNSKFLNLITNFEGLTDQFSNKIQNISQGSNNEAINQQLMSLNNSLVNVSKNVENIDLKIVNLSENISNISQTVTNIEDQISSLKESFSNFNKEAKTESKDNFAKNNENYAELNEKVTNVKKAVENIDMKLEELKESIRTNKKMESAPNATPDIITAINKAVEKIEKNLMEKMDENLNEMTKKVQESEKIFNERTAKVMKALKVIFDVSDMALNYSLQ